MKFGQWCSFKECSADVFPALALEQAEGAVGVNDIVRLRPPPPPTPPRRPAAHAAPAARTVLTVVTAERAGRWAVGGGRWKWKVESGKCSFKECSADFPPLLR